MKWFWYSLIGFCLLMCSCKSKKLDSNVRLRNDILSNLSYLNESVKIDTSKTAYFANEVQRIVIEEVITETEYDKESGKPIKETKTERKTTQDSDKVAKKEEAKGMSVENDDSLNLFADASKKIVSKVEEETIGGQESFGKWIGIILGLTFVAVIIYLYIKKKLRVN